MTDEKLVSYVAKCLKSGQSPDQIKDKLSKAGWQQNIINEVFKIIKLTNATPEIHQTTLTEVKPKVATEKLLVKPAQVPSWRETKQASTGTFPDQNNKETNQNKIPKKLSFF